MGYHLDFTDKAKEDIKWLKEAGNKATLKKLLILLEEYPNILLLAQVSLNG